MTVERFTFYGGPLNGVALAFGKPPATYRHLLPARARYGTGASLIAEYKLARRDTGELAYRYERTTQR